MHRSHGLQHLRHKRPTFAFVGESGYTRHPSPEPRTQRLTRRNRWRFGWGWYHYPRSVPHVSETLRGRGLKRQTLPLLGLGRGCSQRTQRAFGTAMRLCASLSRGVAAPLGCVIFSVSVEIAACTHSALREKSHTRAYTAKHGAFWVGALSLPSERSVRFGNPAWPGLKTANFAAFGSWSGGALEERREPAEQRCAYARRCSKASRPRWAA